MDVNIMQYEFMAGPFILTIIGKCCHWLLRIQAIEFVFISLIFILSSLENLSKE